MVHIAEFPQTQNIHLNRQMCVSSIYQSHMYCVSYEKMKVIWSLPITVRGCCLYYVSFVTFVISVHHESFLLPDYMFIKRLAPCSTLNSRY